ncbi:Nucleotide-binding alpha-beta plait [Penicillium angulare]|uniref:Nucleotide-binding alpha-beta plait n=1 Tax=Penicillium angulare TaxID=116970 RepID=UPI0025410707|nr:Nucleotide-binding alpha-beta plait [Penicillium angulare]KAJ5266829.1 Nucleotide-binding alpha-beta plait [Penicillium angulare]
MTPSPPDEALHFRGKTLTPESPRPLHIPEPSNIPVLENQMDPVFNDTSTYERSVQDSGSLRTTQPGDLVTNDMPVSVDYYHSHSQPQQSGNVNLSNSHIHAHAPPVVPVHQGFATTSEVDNAGNQGNVSHLSQSLEEGNENGGSNTAGVNFQTLLDNLSHLPPVNQSEAAPSFPRDSSLHQAPLTDPYQSQGAPAQPLQDPSTQPNYSSNDDPSYHQQSSAPATSSAYPPQSSNNAQPYPQSTTPGGAPGTVHAANSLPPPPIASFQHTPSTEEGSQTSQEGAQASKKVRIDKQALRTGKAGDDDSPWGPEVQKKYDEFLHDERIYVTEGLWDRFPMGSRLFVGNLPTERVTKRDMFHIFHKYGKLAQISIKQAYGFIQFLEAESCHAALQAEQGALTSKFQSLSVLLGPRPPSHLALPRPDAQDRQSSAEPVLFGPTPVRPVIATIGLMNQADFHLVISGMRLLIADVMTIGPHDRLHLGLFEREMDIDLEIEPLSVSIVVNAGVLGLPGLLDHHILETVGEADLPVPRRAPRDVPEVQVLVLEEVDRNFILHVENAFRNRGLRVDVLVLGPRIPLGAAVHRQYVEGVLAVVRLSRPNLFSRKIPLQIFDRSAGPGNVRFSDYPEVDPNIAAELMFHQAHAMPRGPPPASFAPNPAFGVAPVPTIPVPQPGLPNLTNPPNIANLIGSLDGPSLQSLLSALQRPAPQSQPVSATQSPFSSPNPPPPADLATLLNNATRPVPAPIPQPQPQPQPIIPPPPFNLQHPNAPVVSDPHLLSILAKGLGNQQPQGQPGVGSNVQNLMNQLAKWKQ